MSAAGPVVKEFFDGDFVADPFTLVGDLWDTRAILTDPGTTFQVASLFCGRDATLEFSDVFRRIEVTLPPIAAGTSVGVVVGQIARNFEWNPAVDGAIGLIEFQFDLRGILSSGFAGSSTVSAFFRPILLQDNQVYRASSSVLPIPAPADGSWTPKDAPASFVFSSLADWTRAGVAPNLSAGGSSIRFGFEAALFGTCPASAISGCTSASSSSGVDNFFLRVTGVASQEPPDPSAIPEPGTILLLSAGLLGIAAIHRRRAE